MTPPTQPAPPTSQLSKPFSVAIIGCGPSGCFTAQALHKTVPGIEITVIDALPTPYGLIRHGIAADHQGAKTVQRQFDRLFAQPGVRFIGNTEVGGDLALAALLESFHAVVLATGLAQDRPLGVPQDPWARVIGAGALLRLLNSDPDSPYRHAAEGIPDLGEEIAIVGTGNVAVDLARLLTKSPVELASSDIDDVALHALAPRKIRTIHILGRSEKSLAKWDPSMVKELAAVQAVQLRIDGEMATPPGDPQAEGTLIDVHFRQALHSITAENGRSRVTTHVDGDPTQPRQFHVDTVVSAIGFANVSTLAPHPNDHASPQIFRVGGSVSGRLGNLAENRKLAIATAQAVADSLQSTDLDPRAGYAGIAELLPPAHTTFEHWIRIDEAETHRARPDRCRTKFTTRAELLAAAGVIDHNTTHSNAHPSSVDTEKDQPVATIQIYFGTESGNAEMVADDVAEALQEQGFATDITELSDVAIADLADVTQAVFITSTYGEGELPDTTASFFDDLLAQQPDLTGLSFGAFGLGDSAYETFNNGIERLRAALIGRGAYQIGETAKHDAASGEAATDLARRWAGALMTRVPA